MEYCELSLNIAKEFSKLSSIFTKVVEIQTILNNVRRHLTVFPSDFNTIYLKFRHFTEFNEKFWDFRKVYESLQKFTKVYESLQKFMKVYKSLKFMKVDKSYDIPRYFFSQIPCFRSISFTCDVLFAFHNFVPWQMKFSCLLLYRIASRQYQQLFRHRQTIGDISNIADTYLTVLYFMSSLSPSQLSWIRPGWIYLLRTNTLAYYQHL